MKKFLKMITGFMFVLFLGAGVLTGCGGTDYGKAYALDKAKNIVANQQAFDAIDNWEGVQMNMKMKMGATKARAQTVMSMGMKLKGDTTDIQNCEGTMSLALYSLINANIYIKDGFMYTASKIGTGQTTKTKEALSSLDDILDMTDGAETQDSAIAKADFDNQFGKATKKKHKGGSYTLWLTYKADSEALNDLLEESAGSNSILMSNLKGSAKLGFTFDKKGNVIGTHVIMNMTASDETGSVYMYLSTSIKEFKGTIKAPKGFKAKDYTTQSSGLPV